MELFQRPKLLIMQEKDSNKPQQSEMPFAIVDGEQITELPKDLYIPPVALQIFLDAFEAFRSFTSFSF